MFQFLIYENGKELDFAFLSLNCYGVSDVLVLFFLSIFWGWGKVV